MTKKISYLLVLLAFVFVLALPVLAQSFPNYHGFVNDFANIISDEKEKELEELLSAFERETSNEVALATVNSLEETTVEDYAVRLFEKWQIGKKDKDNGLLFLIAPNERKMKIEVGYGLEGIITDGIAGSILDRNVAPYFKADEMEKGVEEGAKAIVAKIRAGEPAEDIVGQPAASEDGSTIGFLILGFIILIYLSSFFARSKEFVAGGLVGGGLGGFFGLLSKSLASGITLAMMLGVFGFILDLILSGNYKKRKKKGLSTNFWRSMGGFSSGKSSGGGFSFGGGSSGGGGASRGW